jgi:competence protein ComEA
MVRWTKHIAGTLVYVLLGGTTVWGQQPAGAAPPATATSTARPSAATTPAETKININTADEASLEDLKGIGEAKAKAIIEYRQKNGPFKSVDDLKNVKGIGEKTLDDLREQVSVQ